MGMVNRKKSAYAKKLYSLPSFVLSIHSCRSRSLRLPRPTCRLAVDFEWCVIVVSSSLYQ